MGIAATSQQGGFALVGASHANVASVGDDAGAVSVYRYGSGAVGGGDPHIIPIFNPERQVYMLPPNNSVYKYFDNLSADPSDRLVINCQMWVLPVELVQRAAQYQAHGAEVPAELMAELHSRTNVRYDNFKAADTSFAKYLSIMHGDRTLLFDMDTLEPVTTFMNFDSVDGAAARYALIPQPAEDVHEILEGSQITLGPIVQDTQSLFYLDKMHVPHHNNDRKRVVTVRTRTHGDISVVLMTRNDVGHRNEVRLDMCSVGLSQESCVGTLVRIDQREVVPGLTFVHNNPEDSRAWSTDEATLTLDQFRPLLAREARKQRAGVRAGLERRSAALDASISTVAAVEIDMPVA